MRRGFIAVDNEWYDFYQRLKEKVERFESFCTISGMINLLVVDEKIMITFIA